MSGRKYKKKLLKKRKYIDKKHNHYIKDKDRKITINVNVSASQQGKTRTGTRMGRAPRATNLQQKPVPFQDLIMMQAAYEFRNRQLQDDIRQMQSWYPKLQEDVERLRKKKEKATQSGDNEKAQQYEQREQKRQDLYDQMRRLQQETDERRKQYEQAQRQQDQQKIRDLFQQLQQDEQRRQDLKKQYDDLSEISASTQQQKDKQQGQSEIPLEQNVFEDKPYASKEQMSQIRKAVQKHKKAEEESEVPSQALKEGGTTEDLPLQYAEERGFKEGLDNMRYTAKELEEQLEEAEKERDELQAKHNKTLQEYQRLEQVNKFLLSASPEEMKRMEQFKQRVDEARQKPAMQRQQQFFSPSEEAQMSFREGSKKFFESLKKSPENPVQEEQKRPETPRFERQQQQEQAFPRTRGGPPEQSMQQAQTQTQGPTQSQLLTRMRSTSRDLKKKVETLIERKKSSERQRSLSQEKKLQELNKQYEQEFGEFEEAPLYREREREGDGDKSEDKSEDSEGALTIRQLVQLLFLGIDDIQDFDIIVVDDYKKRPKITKPKQIFVFFFKLPESSVFHFTIGIHEEIGEFAHFDPLANRKRQDDDKKYVERYAHMIEPQVKMKFKSNYGTPWQENGCVSEDDSSFCGEYCYIFAHNYINQGENYKEATEFVDREDKEELMKAVQFSYI